MALYDDPKKNPLYGFGQRARAIADESTANAQSITKQIVARQVAPIALPAIALLGMAWISTANSLTLAAQVAQAALPRTTIHTAPLESLTLPRVFDLVIGNVPFSDVGIYDPRVPKRLRRTTHDYFLVRAIDALKPGGFAILITGTGSMDRGSPAVRQHLCGEADLLLALRLPAETFADRGAAVASDLLVFRKLAAPQPGRWLRWTETGTLPAAWPGEGTAATIAGHRAATTNRVFLDDPSLVLGCYERDPRFGTPTVRDRDRSAKDRGYAVRAALMRLPAGLALVPVAPAPAAPVQIAPEPPPEAPGAAPGAAVAEHQATRVLGALRHVLAAETAGEHEEARRWRARLLRNYGHLRATVGPLRHSTLEGRPLHGWRRHPSLPLLMALESPDGQPAPILHGPVLQPQIAASPATPLDALAACIDAGDTLSPEVVAARCMLPVEEVAASLRGRDLVSRVGLVPQELSTDAFETVMNTVSFSRGLFGKPGLVRALNGVSFSLEAGRTLAVVGEAQEPFAQRLGVGDEQRV